MLKIIRIFIITSLLLNVVISDPVALKDPKVKKPKVAKLLTRGSKAMGLAASALLTAAAEATTQAAEALSTAETYAFAAKTKAAKLTTEAALAKKELLAKTELAKLWEKLASQAEEYSTREKLKEYLKNFNATATTEAKAKLTNAFNKAYGELYKEDRAKTESYVKDGKQRDRSADAERKYVEAAAQLDKWLAKTAQQKADDGEALAMGLVRAFQAAKRGAKSWEFKWSFAAREQAKLQANFLAKMDADAAKMDADALKEWAALQKSKEFKAAAKFARELDQAFAGENSFHGKFISFYFSFAARYNRLCEDDCFAAKCRKNNTAHGAAKCALRNCAALTANQAWLTLSFRRQLFTDAA